MPELTLGRVPVAGDDLADGEAVLGVVDRRAASSSAKGRVPNLRQSWSQPSTQPGTDQLSGPCTGIVLQALRLEEVDRGRFGRPAAGVEAVELLGLGVPDDGEQVAADAARHRLDHAEDGVGGDGRVDGVATLLKNLDRRRRRQRLAGRRHPLTGHHRRSRLVQRPGGSIGGGETAIAAQRDPQQGDQD